MKKLLLLLGGLVSSVLPSAAVDIYKVNPTGIKTTDELVSGDYLIYIIPDGTSKKPGYVYYDATGKNSPARHYLSYQLDVTSGEVSDLNYIWTVEKDENNNFSVTLTNDNTKYWIDDERWGQNMTGSTNKAVFTAENSDNSEGIYFKPAEEMYMSDGTTAATNTYLNCNGPIDTYYTSLSYWGGENGKANAAKFIFYPVTKTVQKYPFELSDAPSNGQFAENTHWYYIKLNGRYLAYNDTEESYSNKTQKFIYSYATNPLSYGSFWAFVEEGDNVKIYNAATGASMVLSSDGSTERTNYPSMQADGTDGFTQSWHYTETNDANDASKFYLFLQGTSYNSEDNKLNCYGTANEGNPNNYLTFSTGAGAWSYLTVEPVNINATINSVKTAQEEITGLVGALTNDSYNSFNTALNTGNMVGLVEALKIRDLTGETVQLEENKLYRLENVMRGGILQINSDKQLIKEDALDKSNATELWKIISTDNGVELFNVNAQLSANGTNNATVTEEGSVYTKKDWGSAQFSFIFNSSYLVQYEGGAIGGWSSAAKDSDGAWYIQPVEDIDVNITAAGYATVNYPFAVQVPNEVTAYTGTADADKAVFTLNKIEDGIIPANTPVVLEGTEGTHTLTILADNTTPALESGLKGTLLSKAIEGTTNAYILGNKDSHIGFYQMDATDRTLGANKAYLVLSPEANAVRSIIFSDGTTTGIESTVAEAEEAEEYYDLQGRRVMNPTKGIYVTKSGKKVLFNK